LTSHLKRSPCDIYAVIATGYFDVIAVAVTVGVSPLERVIWESVNGVCVTVEVSIGATPSYGEVGFSVF
jgi:hypothetical protein